MWYCDEPRRRPPAVICGRIGRWEPDLSMVNKMDSKCMLVGNHTEAELTPWVRAVAFFHMCRRSRGDRTSYIWGAPRRT